MPWFLLLMNDDGSAEERRDDWAGYVNELIASKKLAGGSSLGNASAVRKGSSESKPVSRHAGYLLIDAHDRAEAQTLLAGNPAYEAGSSIEIYELVPD
jgi:hypothetical protein